MRDVIDRPHRWWREIDEIDVRGGCGQMTMSVDEARQHGSLAEFDDTSLLFVRSSQLVATYRHDAIAIDEHCLSRGSSRIHRDDATHIQRGRGERGLKRSRRDQQRDRKAALPMF